MWKLQNFNCSSITNIPLALGTTVLFKFFPLTCVQLLQTCRQNSFFINKNLFKSSSVVLVSTYCQSGISTLVSLLQILCLQMTSKTATIQYKPVTSLAGNNNALAYYEQSCSYIQISHALSHIHGLYVWICHLRDITVWTWASYQPFYPANSLGTRLCSLIIIVMSFNKVSIEQPFFLLGNIGLNAQFKTNWKVGIVIKKGSKLSLHLDYEGCTTGVPLTSTRL